MYRSIVGFVWKFLLKLGFFLTVTSTVCDELNVCVVFFMSGSAKDFEELDRPSSGNSVPLEF